MYKVIWLMQLLCVCISLGNGSKIDLDISINHHVEEIIKSSFENISRSLYSDNLRSLSKAQGMSVLSHGMNKPNTQTMQLSCIWDSMKHAAARIQQEIPGAIEMAGIVGAEITGPLPGPTREPLPGQLLGPLPGPLPGPLVGPLTGSVQALCTQLSRSKCGSDHMKTLSCNPNNPYRTVDGTCNNLHNQRWGSAPRAFERYLQADYADRVSSPRSGARTPLPNPRVVSNAMASAENARKKTDVSVMFMQWGQFLNHDITLTPARPSDAGDDSSNYNPGNESNQCCASDDEDCISIDVRRDPYFGNFGVECLPMARSVPAAKGCSFEEMEQVNQNTAFIDASNVYGSSDDVATFVRTKSGGRLNITENESTGKPMPPYGNVGNAPSCPISEPDDKCFLAGDIRIDMVPGLIVMHTAFIRLHNNLADELVRINKHWEEDDEKIYQETRRIVGALAQQITYRDWLPVLLGPTVMAEYNLNVGFFGYRDSYQQYVNPTIRNVFSAAAYRFGHTMPSDILNMADSANDFPQAGHFFNTSVLQNAATGPSSMLKGMARCPMEAVDPVIGSALRNEIFAFPAGSGTGSDLVSINLMRGRDHGIPAYTAWREWCGLKPVTKLKHLKKVMDENIANKLNEIYEGEIKDIDLYAAGLAEHPIADGLLGPTFSCILGRQFSQLKHGDRFWYERKFQPKPFTPGQLSAIRQTGLASIICNVSSGYGFQPDPFKTTDNFGNTAMDCENYAFINLGPWRE